jgi:sugar O-acyltransferase (sialic acid O-acetyltransferase NeuD family)
MKKVIIFGTTQTAELANYYLSQTSDEYEIVAFTVDKQYRQTDLLFGKPLVDFDKVEQIYPPTDYYLFAPMTGKGLNKLRERVFLEGKQKGYKFITYISKYATVLSKDIGENCFILEDNTIQPFVTIGNNCVLWSGNHIGHHSIIKDHVFITSHVVISGNCIINNYCWIGVNATIRNGLNIAEGSLVSMGACLTKDTEPYTVYMGVPAKFKGSSLVEAVSSSL